MRPGSKLAGSSLTTASQAPVRLPRISKAFAARGMESWRRPPAALKTSILRGLAGLA